MDSSDRARLRQLLTGERITHHARFDYAFLQREFARAGIAFGAGTLCTVRLSRRLYPAHARHNLTSLIERHGIACDARHRALGDAQVLERFLRLTEAEFGREALALAADLAARHLTGGRPRIVVLP